MQNQFDARNIGVPRINLVRVGNRNNEAVCEATLLTENSVAMTEWCSNRTDIKWGLVKCIGEGEQGMTLKNPMDSDYQIIGGINIVQVQVSK